MRGRKEGAETNLRIGRLAKLYIDFIFPFAPKLENFNAFVQCLYIFDYIILVFTLLYTDIFIILFQPILLLSLSGRKMKISFNSFLRATHPNPQPFLLLFYYNFKLRIYIIVSLNLSTRFKKNANRANKYYLFSTVFSSRSNDKEPKRKEKKRKKNFILKTGIRREFTPCSFDNTMSPPQVKSSDQSVGNLLQGSMYNRKKDISMSKSNYKKLNQGPLA